MGTSLRGTGALGSAENPEPAVSKPARVPAATPQPATAGPRPAPLGALPAAAAPLPGLSGPPPGHPAPAGSPPDGRAPRPLWADYGFLLSAFWVVFLVFPVIAIALSGLPLWLSILGYALIAAFGASYL